MSKHFENLWEQTESLIAQQGVEDPQTELHNNIDQLFIEADKTRIFGRILCLLCYLSFKWKINTFLALLQEMQDLKIEMMEDES